MHPVGRICSRLAEESRLIDRRILVLSQMVTASKSTPSPPVSSSVSVATQTVVQTYVNASVQAVSVRCMPRAEFLAKIRELVQESALTRIHALLLEMRSSLEAVVAGNELVLNVELARVRTLTGGKGWCTRLVHWKYTARTWTKYPPYTDLGTGSTFRIFQANFFAVSLVQEIPGTFTVSPVMQLQCTDYVIHGYILNFPKKNTAVCLSGSFTENSQYIHSVLGHVTRMS